MRLDDLLESHLAVCHEHCFSASMSLQQCQEGFTLVEQLYGVNGHSTRSCCDSNTSLNRPQQEVQCQYFAGQEASLVLSAGTDRQTFPAQRTVLTCCMSAVTCQSHQAVMQLMS